MVTKMSTNPKEDSLRLTIKLLIFASVGNHEVTEIPLHNYGGTIIYPNGYFNLIMSRVESDVFILHMKTAPNNSFK